MTRAGLAWATIGGAACWCLCIALTWLFFKYQDVMVPLFVGSGMVAGGVMFWKAGDDEHGAVGRSVARVIAVLVVIVGLRIAGGAL